MTSLSPRQQQIMEMTTRGYTAKEIAGELGVSHQTVKNHLYEVRLRLGASTTAQAVYLVYGGQHDNLADCVFRCPGSGYAIHLSRLSEGAEGGA